MPINLKKYITQIVNYILSIISVTIYVHYDYIHIVVKIYYYLNNINNNPNDTNKYLIIIITTIVIK